MVNYSDFCDFHEQFLKNTSGANFGVLFVSSMYRPGIILCMRPANERRRYKVT